MTKKTLAGRERPYTVLGERADPLRIGVTVRNECVPLVERPLVVAHALAPAGDLLRIESQAEL